MSEYGIGYTGEYRSRLSPPTVGDDSSTWTYSDVDFIFKPSPIARQNSVGGDIARKFDGDSIKQSVKNILLSNKYERPWKPYFGPNVRDLLFENSDSPLFFLQLFTMQEKIQNQLGSYEPRIKVVSVNASVNELKNTVNISVDYKLKPVQKDSITKQIIVKIVGERVR